MERLMAREGPRISRRAFGAAVAAIYCSRGSLAQQESAPPITEPKRIRVGDSQGRVEIAREYGPSPSTLAMLPDGRIVKINRQIYTEDPFQPVTMDALRDRLVGESYQGYQSRQTDHYLILYRCSPKFAEASARLLESLYCGLVERLTRLGFEVKPAEFPLVAIIHASEKDFRDRRTIDADVQAYYEIMSNQVHFYEQSEVQREDPMWEAMRKPQTVAHEGTHQVLNNIGIQPRMAEWPLWLVEGLAELAASNTETSRDGGWVGLSRVNQLHIATLDDLEDDLTQQSGANGRVRVGADWGRSMVEYLVSRDQLQPTDYALAWTLTHFLANERTAEFIAFLKDMGQRVPGAARVPSQDLDTFRKHFGDGLLRSDAPLRKHIGKLRKKSTLTYYAVMFQQALPGNLARRGTLVSRSPQVIRQWVEQRMYDPAGGAYQWQAVPFRSKQDALLYTDQWLTAAP